METLVYLLILFPLVPALACLFLPEGMWRGLVIKGSALALGVGAILLAFQYTGSEPVLIDLHLHLIDEILFWAGLAVAGYLLYRCRSIRKAEAYIPVLIVVQAAIIGWCEKSGQMPKVEAGLYIDHLSVIMALIIGIVGGVIAIYAVSYMRDYHSHHGDVPEGRKGFFFTVFLFLGAMFGIVFSNNLSWLYFCWEITTLCSFLMIGYSKSEEATRNAFLALGLNLLGGLGFTIAIFIFTTARAQCTPWP
jgi:ech hydrogenase subunit A